jgi:DNA replication protein DnaC
MAACERCQGTGFEIVTRDGREFAQPCACRKPRPDDRTADAFLKTCRIPPRYEDCSFSTFEGVTALERCMVYCNEYPHLGKDEGLGLLFTGSNGIGKTHLAVSVLRELWVRKGVRGQFWDFHDLIRVIRDSYNADTNASELQVLQPVIGADLLLLDDLGAWKMTEWINDTLFYVMNSRYMTKRPTLITTNFEDVDRQTAMQAEVDYFEKKRKGLADAPPPQREFLLERTGLGVRSRLMEMCHILRMHGNDYREGRQVMAPYPRGRADVGQ